jgi:hypothetical protein
MMMESDWESVEQQIRSVLASESDCISLSNRLFGPQGLFGKLAPSRADRRTVTRSTLFRQAQQRLSELRRKDAQQFSQLVGQFQRSHNGNEPTIRFGSV